METNQLLNISPSQLRRAADVKERIEVLTKELSGILGGVDTEPLVIRTTAGILVAGKKRGMSAEGRRRVGEAARARWAKINAAKATTASTPSESGGGAQAADNEPSSSQENR